MSTTNINANPPSTLAAGSAWPDIGLDPLKHREQVEGGVEGAVKRLNQAVAIQQKEVPDQTLLAWRIDVDRVLCELIVMTARWKHSPNNPQNDRGQR